MNLEKRGSVRAGRRRRRGQRGDFCQDVFYERRNKKKKKMKKGRKMTNGTEGLKDGDWMLIYDWCFCNL